jgi:hypothetical protein
VAEKHCVGPVADPAAALADLRGHFDDRTLEAAGVLSTSSPEGSHLHAMFTSADAAFVVLYGGLNKSLRGLLTPWGCIPLRALPATRVFEDQWTCEALESGEVLYATPDVREVALLRSLGMPATLSLKLDRLSYWQLSTGFAE